MKRNRNNVLWIAAMLLLSSFVGIGLNASAQPDNVWVSGYILDNGGSAISGATVYLQNTQTEDTNATSTNATGFFNISIYAPPVGDGGAVFLISAFHEDFHYNSTYIWLAEGFNQPNFIMNLDPATNKNSYVQGTIRDAITGAPLPFTGLSVLGQNYINTTSTNATGEYGMFLESNQRYYIQVSRAGYDTETVTSRFDFGDNKVFDFLLEPTNCTLKGYVNNASLAVGSASVLVYRLDQVAQKEFRPPVNFTDGYFELNLSRGVWQVEVEDGDHFTQTITVLMVNGETTWQNFTLYELPSERAIIEGWITYYENGSAAPDIEIVTENQNGTLRQRDYSDGSGYYNISVIPGDLVLVPRTWGYSGAQNRITTQAGGSYALNMTLIDFWNQDGYLEGYARYNAVGEPDVQIIATFDNWWGEAWTDGTGYYNISVPGAPLTVRAVKDGFNSSTVGVNTHSSLTTIQDFDLSLLDWSTEIRGYINNSKGDSLEGAFISYDYDGTGSGSATGMTDYTGLYQMMAPSGYSTTFVLAEGHEYKTSEVNMPANEIFWYNETLTPVKTDATIICMFTNIMTGKPIKNVEVAVGELDLDWFEYHEADKSGILKANVPAGFVQVRFDARENGYEEPGMNRDPSTMQFRIKPSETRWLNISLFPREKTAAYQGYVNDTGGSPIAGAIVTVRYGDTVLSNITDASGYYKIKLPGDTMFVSWARTPGYKVQYYMDWVPDQGVVWYDWALDNAGATIEGPITDYAEDLDADLKYDYLYVNVTVNVTNPGNYVLEGFLSSSRSSNQQIASVQEYFGGTPGLRVITLAFMGEQIRLSEEDGFYVEFDIRDENTWENLDYTDYFTTKYRFNEFEIPDATIEKPVEYWLVDSDFDGLFNYLIINVTLNVSVPGNYTLMAPIRDIWGTEFDNTLETFSLETGLNQVQLSIDGTSIYNNGETLGSVYMVLFEGFPMGGMDYVDIHYFYIPFSHDIFQFYVIDAYVSGNVTNSGGQPIEGMTVWLYNITSKYLDSIQTNATGYYELGGWAGDWVLVVTDEGDMLGYQGNLTEISLSTGGNSHDFLDLQGDQLDIIEIQIVFSDWNTTHMDWLLSAEGDGNTLRFEMDVLQFGNRDGFLSEDEVQVIMGMLGGISLPDSSIDSFLVDSNWYDLNQTTKTIDVGLVGSITSTDPVYIHLTGDYTANSSIPLPSPHDLELNCTYDDEDPQMVSDNNATFIYYVTVPSNWGRTGNGTPQNVTISGSDYITFDPLNDPNTSDGISSEWVNATISIGLGPTVGIVRGNVTLDGSGDHSGVVVTLYDNSTQIEVALGATNPQGYYEITGIAPGNYDVVAHKAGYLDNISRNITLNAGDILWFDFTMYSMPPTITHNPVTSAILGDAINIACDVSDDGEVDSVILYYKDVGSGSYSQTTMIKIPSTSTYMGTIPAQAALGYVDYYIWANDTKGNWGNHPGTGNHSIWIYEITPPDIATVMVIPDPAEYPEFVNISAQITDFSAVETVNLSIELPDMTTANLTMTYDTASGRYYLNSSYSLLGTYNYTIWAKDSYDNWNSYSGNFQVLDTILPTSSVDLLVPYWFAISPALLTSQANDSGIGVEKVELWYRHSTDNGSWGGWTMFGVDTAEPWSWNFNFPDGDGYYEFFSIANDTAGNPEAMKNVAETICAYDTTGPTSVVDIISVYWHGASPLTVNATAADDMIGVENVELWYRNSTDNVSWGSWTLFGVDPGAPWSWNFTFPDGDGYYEFFSIARDILGNPESMKVASETMCAFDTTGPTSGLNVIASYWQTTTPLVITSNSFDDMIGVSDVELWFRSSSDNSSWTIWSQFAIDNAAPWSWDFTFPDGDGYYEFFSIANDGLGNGEAIKVAAETICSFDTTAPVSMVNNTTSYWLSTTPLTITATSADGLVGTGKVELWFRNSPDNSSWGNWTLFGVDLAAPWSWDFDFPSGDGYYEFFSIGNDSLGNSETMKVLAEFQCVLDTTGPSSGVNVISPYWQNGASVTITAFAVDDGVGLKTVSLWFRHSSDNSSWSSWSSYGSDSSLPWSFSFDFPDGEGYYQFYSLAVDDLDNMEISKSSREAICARDTSSPTIDTISVTPDPDELGDDITITVSPSDVSGISEVWIEIMLGTTTVGNFSMSQSGNDFEYVYAPDDVGTAGYVIWVADERGNWATDSASSEIVDTHGPTVSDFTITPSNPEVGDPVTVTINTSDVSGISDVFILITDPDGQEILNESMTMNPATGSYSHQTDYDDLGVYNIDVWIVDENGQWTLYGDTITIVDTESPVADAGPDQQVTVGTQITLDGGGSTDNHGIVNYTWEFNDNGLKKLYGQSVSYTFTSAGANMITLKVRDEDGNVGQDVTWINVSAVSGTGTVTGTVLDKDGNPVEGAEVYVEGSPNIKNTTDNRGVYILDDVPIGSQNIWVVKNGYERDSITVDVLQDQSTTNDFEIAKKPSGESSPVALFGILAAIIAIVVVLLLYLLTKKKPKTIAEETVIDEVFFMYNDGRLIKHFTRRLKPDMDEDILSSMLVAVQDFVKDSFRDQEGVLDEMNFGRFQVLLGRGEHIILATMILGDDPSHLRPQIEQCVKDIEERYKEQLEKWDGDMQTLMGASKYVMDLIDGKYA